MDMEVTNFYLGWAAISAGIIGPITAVVITLVWEKVRRTRELKLNTLQNILVTRGRYSEPLYSATIRSVPIVFSKNKKVMNAYLNYMDATRNIPNDENREKVNNESARRESILITEMLTNVGYKGLTAEKVESYTSVGLVNRDILVENALVALPIIAINARKSAEASEKICDNIISQGKS